MSFFIPKCPILVVCAVVLCFMSKLDPNAYFLPSILFKDKFVDADDDDDNTERNTHFISGNNDTSGGWTNKHLRIGVREKDKTKDERPKKDRSPEQMIQFAETETKKKEKKKNGEADKTPAAEIVKPSSSRKEVEVKAVVANETPKNKADNGGNSNFGNQQQEAAKIPPEGSKPAQFSQPRKQKPERTGKPLFILHIGPPKTGTTTLQCELGKRFQELKEENFYYLGTYYAPLCGLPVDHVIEGFSDVTRPVLLRCYSDHANQDCDDMVNRQWKDFENILLSHKDHNVIMSDEMFHHHFQEEDVQRVAKILNPYWDVRIMYTYRHFYSSLPSMYHQLNDPYATDPGMAFAHEKTIWPEDGGYTIPPFREGNYFGVDEEMDRFQLWTTSFNWVEVFDMHNTKGDYLPDFLCTMIPEFKALCRDAKRTDAPKHKDNDSSSKYLHYDMLAVEAREQGLLKHTDKTREAVRDAVQEFCRSKDWEFTHFPLDCLSEPELDSFLHESLEQASILQPYFANPRDSRVESIESEIRSGFQDYRDKKKFCSVDTKKTLSLHPWRQFFLNLE